MWLIYFRLPEEPSTEELEISNRIYHAHVKTQSMKKGFTKTKNLMAALKKDLLSQEIGLPNEAMQFLQDDDIFDKVLEVAHKNISNLVGPKY